MKNPFVLEIAQQLSAAAGAPAAEVEGALTTPPDAAMGDYTFPCFNLAKAQRRKPNEIES